MVQQTKELAHPDFYSSRILLVEDEGIIAFTQTNLLKKRGFQVTHVYDGESAVQKARESKDIDLILMDIDLGSGIDGTEAAEIILKEQDVPILFVSSHTRPEIVEKTEKITSYGYVVKNAGETVLLASVKMALRLHQARKALKRNERILQAQKEKFQISLDASSTGCWEYYPQSRTLVGDEHWAKLIGYRLEEIENQFEFWKSIVHPDDYEESVKTFFDHLEGRTPYYEARYRLKHKKGHWIWIFNRAKVVNRAENGEAQQVIGIQMDVSESIRDRKLLEETEEMFRLFMEHFPGLAYIKDYDSRFKFANSAMYDFLGKSKEEVLGKTNLDLYPRKIAESMNAEEKRVMDSGKSEQLQLEGFWPKMDRTFASIRFRLGGKESPPLIGRISMDISKQKQLENDIRNQQEKLKATLESIGDGVISTDREGKIEEINQVASKLTGYSKAEAIGEKLQSIFHIVSSLTGEPAEDPLQKAIREGVVVGLANHTTLISKDGTEYQIADSAAPIRDISGEILGAIMVFRNVSEEYSMRAALERSEETMRLAMEFSQEGVWDWETRNETATMSPSYWKMLGYESDEFVMDRSKWQALIHPEDLETVNRCFREILEGRSDSLSLEYRIRGKSGDYHWLLSRARVVEKDSENKPERIIGADLNITEVKDAEFQKEEALKEKESLLQELQHRVKNSLTLINSLIELEKMRSTEEESNSTLTNLQSRIHAMSELYSILYTSEQTRHLRLDVYFENVITSIQKSYLQSGSSHSIQTELESIRTNAKQATALGLILNELVTNALKYSFSGKKSGTVYIGLSKYENNSILLLIRDNGRGFPKDFDIKKSEGLGLQLVQTLTQQMKGSCTQERKGEWTEFRILVNLEEI